MKEQEMSLPIENSAGPEFWNERYGKGETPWVMHQIPEALDAFLRRATPGLVLIPGCGNNYEIIRAFDAAGFVVSGIDFSSAALNQAKTALGSLGERLILGDFFQHDFGQTRFDFVFDRTFLCALNPSRWDEYRGRLSNLLRPEGSLVGIFFYGHELEPPPFPLTRERAAELFGNAFCLQRDDPVPDSIAIFRDQERWQEWQLRSPSW